jgi:hypothetical protein
LDDFPHPVNETEAAIAISGRQPTASNETSNNTDGSAASPGRQRQSC